MNVTQHHSYFILHTSSFLFYFFSAAGGSLKGACRMVLTTAPLRRHCVHTRIDFRVPLGVLTCTFCKFGLNVRREIPVTLVPTPPRYFALPRCVIELPIAGFFPHTSHARAMVSLPSRALESKNRKLSVYRALMTLQGVRRIKPHPHSLFLSLVEMPHHTGVFCKKTPY